MAAIRVTLNHAGMRALLNSAGVRANMMSRAASAADVARANAPVKTGAYQASIHAESATTDRAVGRVVADVSYAQEIEFYIRNLGRALDAARVG